MFYTYIDTPVGPFMIAGDPTAVRMTSFTGGSQHRRPAPGWVQDRAPLERAARQLEEYFAGRRAYFDVPIELSGTRFQRAVWQQLRDIPFGETRAYGEIARAMKSPRAGRAVGAANVANVLPVLVPCHRVVGANGALTGFGGGLRTKQWLLALEGARPAH